MPLPLAIWGGGVFLHWARGRGFWGEVRLTCTILTDGPGEICVYSICQDFAPLLVRLRARVEPIWEFLVLSFQT